MNDDETPPPAPEGDEVRRWPPNPVAPGESSPPALGRQTRQIPTRLDRIHWPTQRRAVSHGPEAHLEVALVVGNFTSRCPVTDQPDYASLTIRYVPREWLAETKSLKLWLERYRDRGQFNEAIAAEIASDLAAQLSPSMVEVEATFEARGGIQPVVRATVFDDGRVQDNGLLGGALAPGGAP